MSKEIIIQPNDTVQLNFFENARFKFLAIKPCQLGFNDPIKLSLFYKKVVAMEDGIPYTQGKYPTIFNPKWIFSVSINPERH